LIVSVLNVLLPLGSVVVGAGITYWINVRARRLGYREDLFNEAMEAVSVAEISVDFRAWVERPALMSEEDYAHVVSWHNMEGVKNATTRVIEANVALARVLPHQPELSALLPFDPHTGNRGRHLAIIEMLKVGRAQSRARLSR
jgi:hypothetical protein